MPESSRIELIRAERSSNGSCRSHRAPRAHISTRRTLELLLSYLSSFVSPLRPLGLGFLLACGNVRRACCRSGMLLSAACIAVWVCLVLQLYAV